MPPRRLPDFDRGTPTQVTAAGEIVRGYAGENLAVALHASGAGVLARSIKYHRPRSSFCLEGHCGGCLVRIDGVPNIRACMTPCRDGAVVEGQNAYPSPDLDVLAAVDWVFPGGMNHHTLMTGSRVLNRVTGAIVRRLSGLGQLPEVPPAGREYVALAEDLAVDVLVIGAGAAGLAAATAAAEAGARTLVCDEQDIPGGSLLADPRHGPSEAARRAQAAVRAGVRLEQRATCIGYYPEDGGGVIAVAAVDLLLVVRARAVVYATGGYAQNRLFANNDRPGVMAARAVGRMLVRHGVLAGERVCLIAGDGAEADYAAAMSAALSRAGCEVTAVDPRQRHVVAARGRPRVRALEVADASGHVEQLPCDLVAVAAPPSPASEGPRQHGCRVALDPRAGGFAVEVDADGRTTVAGVFACGDVCGATTPARASEAGARAGRAAAEHARS